MSRNNKKDKKTIIPGTAIEDTVETPEMTEETPEEMVEESAPASAPNSFSSYMIVNVIEGVNEGVTIEDFKVRLSLNGLMKDTDDLQIGRLGKTGQFHMAIINQKESRETYQVMIAGKLVAMGKDTFDTYYMKGTYLGADLILYMDQDSMILLRDTIIVTSEGTITKL